MVTAVCTGQNALCISSVHPRCRERRPMVPRQGTRLTHSVAATIRCSRAPGRVVQSALHDRESCEHDFHLLAQTGPHIRSMQLRWVFCTSGGYLHQENLFVDWQWFSDALASICAAARGKPYAPHTTKQRSSIPSLCDSKRVRSGGF